MIGNFKGGLENSNIESNFDSNRNMEAERPMDGMEQPFGNEQIQNILNLDNVNPLDSDRPTFYLPEETIAFSNMKEMKEKLEMSYKEIKEEKPLNSPNLAKWFDKGGQLEIGEQDGKNIWTYINPEGVAVSYVDGYPVFPQETKHPYIEDLDIGSFTGNRNEDKRLYLEKLEDEYGLTEVPDGYVLHHDVDDGNMQLVKEKYHKEFTHTGGHSKFKEGTEC